MLCAAPVPANLDSIALASTAFVAADTAADTGMAFSAMDSSAMDVSAVDSAAMDRAALEFLAMEFTATDPCPAPSAPMAAAPRRPRSGVPRRGGAFEHLPAGLPLPLEAVLSAPARFALPLAIVAAGFPSPADDYAESRIDLNRELIPRPLSTFFMRVSGDAMAADGILDGDLLVIDRSVRARAGLVVVVTHEGSFLVRRLRRAASGSASPWQLLASDGSTAPLPLAEGVTEIWGVVIHAVHHLASAGSPRR